MYRSIVKTMLLLLLKRNTENTQTSKQISLRLSRNGLTFNIVILTVKYTDLKKKCIKKGMSDNVHLFRIL